MLSMNEILNSDVEQVHKVEYDARLYSTIAKNSSDIGLELIQTKKSHDKLAFVENITRLSWNQLQRIPVDGVDRFTKMYNLYNIYMNQKRRKAFKKYCKDRNLI